MSLVFDSVLAAALARELDAAWAGRRLEALRFDSEARHLRLGFRDEAWIWLLHPRDGVLVPVPGPRAGEDRGRGSDRGVLDGPRRIVAVASPPDTRRIVFDLDGPPVGGGGSGGEHLVLDLVTNRWNALYVVKGRVHRVLVPGIGRDPTEPGDEWAPSASERRWAESPPGPEEWAEVMARAAREDRGARGHVAWLSGMNESWVMRGPDEAPEGPADAAVRRSLERYLALRDAALHDPPAGWLLPGPGEVPSDEIGVRPYVAPLGTPEAEDAGSLLAAFAAIARRSARIGSAMRTASESPEAITLREALEERRARLEKKIGALRSEVGEGGDPETLRGLGHLLLARKKDVRPGAAEVRLEDFAGGEVAVALDPALDAVENAEAYYERARRVERAAAELPHRIRTAEKRLEKLAAALERLGTDGPDEAAWKLAGGRPRPTTRRGRGPSTAGDRAGEALPYRVYRTGSGREIRAGRSARANDELTFRHSAPDDIWMHVREAPGSHVVLRWGDRDQNPPEADIAEAALVAAVLSRARGSAMVPVAWTRRKYVRKPRKAPPGTVVPERTQTVFVRPDEKRVRAMADDD